MKTLNLWRIIVFVMETTSFTRSNMKFTYVLTEWEGIFFDSRILKDAFVREDPLVIPEG